MNTPHVAILLLNWNGWRDTVRCLETLLRLDYPSCQILVCDNGSSDGSLDHLKAWAHGDEPVDIDAHPSLRHLIHPECDKPVPWSMAGKKATSTDRLTFMDNASNRGFAAGNNAGLRWLLENSAADYVWLLNNDTLCPPNALSPLVERMQTDSRVGMCGSTLLYADRPARIQTLCGGRLNRWLATPHPICAGGTFAPSDHLQLEVERSMDFVCGASMLVSRSWLEQVGLLDERFFLYFEEIDWALRGTKSFTLGYAPESVVYHREGASIGGSGLDPADKSETADRHYLASRFAFCRKHYPASLPLVYASLIVTLANRIRRGQAGRIPMVLQTALNGLRFPKGKGPTSA